MGVDLLGQGVARADRPLHRHGFHHRLHHHHDPAVAQPATQLLGTHVQQVGEHSQVGVARLGLGRGMKEWDITAGLSTPGHFPIPTGYISFLHSTPSPFGLGVENPRDDNVNENMHDIGKSWQCDLQGQSTGHPRQLWFEYFPNAKWPPELGTRQTETRRSVLDEMRCVSVKNVIIFVPHGGL